MIKQISLSLMVSIAFVGCGGGGGSSDTPSESQNTTQVNTTSSTEITTTEVLSPSDLDLAKDIEEGKISGYSADDSIEDQYLSVVNYLRSLKIKCNDPLGLEGPSGSDLEWNVLLEDAAKEHSEDMRDAKHYAHDGSGTVYDKTAVGLGLTEGSTPFERMSFNGYDYSNASENIAKVARYPELEENEWLSIMQEWMKSDEGHCSNIMNPNFIDFGMSETSGTEDIEFSDGVTRSAPVLYWTQNFGKPQ